MKKQAGKIRRLFCMLLVCSTLFSMAACQKLDIEDRRSYVAGVIEGTDEIYDSSYHISLEDNGMVSVYGNPYEFFIFDAWEDIVSVSVGGINAGGIKSDGTVVVTGYAETGTIDIEDWRDIIMLEFTLFSAYGLKSNGKVISTDDKYIDEIPEFKKKILDAVAAWRHIVYIDASAFTVVGVKTNGRVVIATDGDEEFIERTADWRNIKQVSVSDYMIVGLTDDGKVLVAHDGWTGTGDYQLKLIEDEWVLGPPRPVSLTIDYLQGVIKVCAGDTFLAGLMPDGTLKTCEGGGSGTIPEDVLALDGEEDVVDINSQADTLVVLKKDGTIIMAGRDD